MPQRKVICSHDPKTKSIKFYSEKPSSHSIPYLLSSYVSVPQSILNFFCIHSDKLIANITLDSPPLHKKLHVTSTLLPQAFFTQHTSPRFSMSVPQEPHFSFSQLYSIPLFGWMFYIHPQGQASASFPVSGCHDGCCTTSCTFIILHMCS